MLWIRRLAIGEQPRRVPWQQRVREPLQVDYAVVRRGAAANELGRRIERLVIGIDTLSKAGASVIPPFLAVIRMFECEIRSNVKAVILSE